MAGKVASEWADMRPRMETLGDYLRRRLVEHGYGLAQGIHVVERVMAKSQGSQTVVIDTAYRCERMAQDEIFAYPR